MNYFRGECLLSAQMSLLANRGTLKSTGSRVSSFVVSASEGPGELRRSRFHIWPEWNETEVNAEKWDAAKVSKDGKPAKTPFSVSVLGQLYVAIC